jgi:hypothetical protein
MPAKKSAPVSSAAPTPVPAPAAPAAKKATRAKVVKAAKPAQPAPASKPRPAAKPSKAPKVQRKPVRDSFTMPEADFALIATLKARALSAKVAVKKSELLRAGLHALAALPTPALIAGLAQLEPVKIGRPKKA